MLASIQSDRQGNSRDRFALPQAYKLVGDIAWRTGDRAGAAVAWKTGLKTWPKGVAETPSQMAARGEMLRGTGQRADGRRIATRLATTGYRQSLSNRANI